MAERTAWALCSAMSWWSAFGKPRRGKAGRPGPPVHDDRVQRIFTAPPPNRLWLTDITEHPTAEGKPYLCAIKDVHSNRFVGYAMEARMQSRLAVAALESAVARRTTTGTTSPTAPSHSARDRRSGPDDSCTPWAPTTWSNRWVESVPLVTTRRWSLPSRHCRRTCSTGSWTSRQQLRIATVT